MVKDHWASWILHNVIGAVIWLIGLLIVLLIIMICVGKFKELMSRN